MDARITGFIISGFIAGSAGAAINTYLWMRTYRRLIHSGQPTTNRFENFLKQELNKMPSLGSGGNTNQINQDILNLFDEFMSDRLVQKMPVLKMFMDDQLIAEIRTIFHSEMEQHLPSLLKKNMMDENTISSISGLFRDSMSNLFKKYRLQGWMFVLISGFVGGMTGLIIGFTMK